MLLLTEVDHTSVTKHRVGTVHPIAKYLFI